MHTRADVACSHWLIIATNVGPILLVGPALSNSSRPSAVEYSITQKIYYMRTFQKGDVSSEYIVAKASRSAQSTARSIASISILLHNLNLLLNVSFSLRTF